MAVGKLNGEGNLGHPGRILGLDPGLRVTGYALLEIPRRTEGVILPVPSLLEAGVIRSSGRTLPERLRSLYHGLQEILEEYRPGIVVVEELFAHYAHPRTAVLMAHARGALLLAAAQCRLPCLSYTATRIKKVITGSGRANKSQIQRTMLEELHLEAVPEPPDVADALAAALCHYHLAVRRAG